MIQLTDVTGLLTATLVIAAASLTLAGVSVWDKHYRIIGLCVVTVAALLPIDGLPVAGYIRGIIGDLSITTVVLLVLGLGRRIFAWRPMPDKQVLTVYGLVLLCGGIFYPMTLGATSYDPYRLGYGSYSLLSVLLLVVFVAWLKDQLLLVICITLAVLAFVAGWYESTNLWDYLMDPLLAVYALCYLLTKAGGRAVSRKKSTSSSQRPR